MIFAVETWGVFLQLIRLGCGFLGPRGCFRKADSFTFAASALSTFTNLVGVIF
jgi:hypothetical protein